MKVKRLYYRATSKVSKDPHYSVFAGVSWIPSKGKYKAVFRGKKIGEFAEASKAAEAYAEVREAAELAKLDLKGLPRGLPRGVYWHKASQQFGVKITIKGKTVFLGYRKDLKDACIMLEKYLEERNSWTRRRFEFDLQQGGR